MKRSMKRISGAAAALAVAAALALCGPAAYAARHFINNDHIRLQRILGIPLKSYILLGLFRASA